MNHPLRSLTAGNLFALGVVGFCGAFSILLFKGLWIDAPARPHASLDLIAAVLLLCVCATSWPEVSRPERAHVSLKSVAVAVLACVLAVLARTPGIGA